MNTVHLILEKVLYFQDGQFEARLKVIKVPKSAKFPDGFKVNCILLDKETKTARLLLDNHAPFGYHLHTELPNNKHARLAVDVKNYSEAIQVFFREARKIADEKN